jgi:hypothetical protein
VVERVAFNDDSTPLATARTDETVRLWDPIWGVADAVTVARPRRTTRRPCSDSGDVTIQKVPSPK